MISKTCNYVYNLFSIEYFDLFLFLFLFLNLKRNIFLNIIVLQSSILLIYSRDRSISDIKYLELINSLS